ncbi:unnamed protein product [Adineta ricciae]|uniref:Uncharacterized protein n=1 Tax=Adineta ricciae TaxID=249248 RepID=A0A816CYX3_ADIRI|nr:unnamed protein product [Adineta ricciae]
MHFSHILQSIVYLALSERTKQDTSYVNRVNNMSHIRYERNIANTTVESRQPKAENVVDTFRQKIVNTVKDGTNFITAPFYLINDIQKNW